MADREVDKEANEGRDFTHPDEVTTPGAISSLGPPRVSRAAPRRNVVREAWAEEKKVAFPIDEATQKILHNQMEAEMEAGTCLRCNQTSQLWYMPCHHFTWCCRCKEWADRVVARNLPNAHLCIICDKEDDHTGRSVLEVESNPGTFWKIEEKRKKCQNGNTITEGRDFTHPDEVTTPGQSSSSGFRQASEAAGERNVIREAWAEEQNVTLPLDEATQKLLVDREEVGICLRCNQTSQIHYTPCFHHPWCRPCKGWADGVVEGKLPNAHLCIICDAKMKNYAVYEVKPNPGDFWRKIVEEKEKERKRFNTIDEHLMQLKKNCLCHRCLAGSTHQNVPCHCRAWCADCSTWAKKLLEIEETRCICIHCQNPVTAITLPPSYEFCNSDEVTTPGESSSSSFPQASEAAGRRNVIREAWAEENGVTLPLDEATQKLLVDREKVGICLRCNKTSQIRYNPCLHYPWCGPCKQWADRVVKGNLPNPHMCIICDEKMQGCFQFESNLGPFRRNIVEEKEMEGQDVTTIIEHLMQLKTNCLCHRCLARSTYQNVPCHCHAWCADCTSWAKKLLEKEEARCSRCENPVTAITLAPPSYDLTPRSKSDKQEKKKKKRQMK